MIDQAGRDHHAGAALRRDFRRLDLRAHAAARQLGTGLACHCLDLGRDPLNQRDQLCIGMVCRRRSVEAIYIREQHQ